jgi:hypothetical protein
VPVHNHFVRDSSGNISAGALAQVGPLCPIEIHVPPAIAQILSNAGQPIPNCVTGMALIDTGATVTCVHEPILQGLGLNPVGIVNLGTANGPTQQNVYPVRIICPTQGWTFDPGSATGVNLTGQVLNVSPPVAIIALLGRDLLQNWMLVYNGPLGLWSVGH